MKSYPLNRDVIKGVKVIGAREGSVIVDIQILHSETSTSQQAFDSFINSVFESEALMNVLRIKTHMTPVLVDIEYGGIQLSPNLVTIVAVLIPVAVLFLAASVFLVFRRRKAGKMEVERIPPSYENGGAEINDMQ